MKNNKPKPKPKSKPKSRPSLETQIKHLQDELTKLRQLFTYRFECELAGFEQKLNDLSAGTGGLWRTAKGEVLFVRNMDISHIQNCLKLSYLSESARAMFRKELERRGAETEYRPRVSIKNRLKSLFLGKQ